MDFSSIPDDLDDDEDITDEPASESAEQTETTEKADPKKWPWENVRDRLRDALAEVSVLSDVLSIATKECGRDPTTNHPRRYMVLDGPMAFEPPESRPYVSLLAKKKALDGHVAKILMSGADHLKSLQSEGKTNPGESKANNFHFQLLKLRQHWRLKKVSNTILGDLSFRTAGSQFKQSGIFEVIKADESDKVGEEGDEAMVVDPSKSVLKVNVPAELEGIAFIQVTSILYFIKIYFIFNLYYTTN